MRVIQMFPESANRSGSSAAGGQISRPQTNAFQIAFREGRTPLTITAAPMNEIVIRTDPAPTPAGTWS